MTSTPRDSGGRRLGRCALRWLALAAALVPAACVPDFGQTIDRRAAYIIVLIACGIAVGLVLMLRAVGGDRPDDDNPVNKDGEPPHRGPKADA